MKKGAVYKMSLSQSFCTKELITKYFLALFAVQLMALWVTVLCLGSDLACGRVATGSGAKQKQHWEQIWSLRTTEAN